MTKAETIQRLKTLRDTTTDGEISWHAGMLLVDLKRGEHDTRIDKLATTAAHDLVQYGQTR